MQDKSSAGPKPFFSPGPDYSVKGFQLYFGEHILEMVEAIDTPRNGWCLEVGVGDARFKQPLQRRGLSFVGLDIYSDRTIDIKGDAHGLPFRAEAVDLAIMNQVMEHLSQPWDALKELNRVLKHGGYFVGSVAFLEPFHNSYFHFSHWGIEQILRDTGFEPLEVHPGINMIPLLAWTMTEPGPSHLAARLAGTLAGFMMKVRYLGGAIFIRSRFGRSSPYYKTFRETRKRDPFKYAGHIYFAARKVGPGR